jgi:hypothetical protein
MAVRIANERSTGAASVLRGIRSLESGAANQAKGLVRGIDVALRIARERARRGS